MRLRRKRNENERISAFWLEAQFRVHCHSMLRLAFPMSRAATTFHGTKHWQKRVQKSAVRDFNASLEGNRVLDKGCVPRSEWLEMLGRWRGLIISSSNFGAWSSHCSSPNHFESTSLTWRWRPPSQRSSKLLGARPLLDFCYEFEIFTFSTRYCCPTSCWTDSPFRIILCFPSLADGLDFLSHWQAG